MDKIKFITIEQLLEMIENNEKFKLVEVLSEENFKQGHIPNAINLPVDKLKEIAGKHLKKDEVIVVYCMSYVCHASTKASEILLNLGFKNILDYKAGKQGWINNGLELEKSA